MRPELQALSNRVAELLFDDELKTRVERFLKCDEQKRYKANVDQIFNTVFPAYGDAVEVLGEHVDEIWADPVLSEPYALLIETWDTFREHHRELTTLLLSLTPGRRNL